MYSESQKNLFHTITSSNSKLQERKEKKEREEEMEANLVILGKRNSDSSTAKDGAWVSTISDDNVVGR